MGSTAIALVVAEIGLRVIGVEPARWAHANHLESADKRYVIDAYPDDPRGAFDLDLRDDETRARWTERGVPRLDVIAERTPHAVGARFDAQLCRLWYGLESPRAPRVLIVGDSFAEGQGVDGNDTFAAKLGEALEADANVTNCGRRGYDFPTLAESFEARLEAVRPDVVVYAMVLNDAQRSEAFEARQPYLNDWIVDRRRMLADDDAGPSFWTSRLWWFAVDRIEAARVADATTRWYLDMYGAPNAEGWAATQDHIVAMRDLARGRGARFVVALLPLLVALDDYPFASLSDVIASALERRGVPFHDVTPAFLGRDETELWVHPMDHHPNEAAHRLIAEELEGVVRPLLRGRSGE